MTELSSCRTIALFGDSIACGLGVRDRRYGQIVCAQNDLDLLDFAKSGSTIDETWQAYLDQGAPQVEFAVIAHGITEPIPRPRANQLRYLPPRWRRTGWMDPRPYFSRRRGRRLLEKIESSIRWRVKNLLMRIGGHETFRDEDNYVASMLEACTYLIERGVTVIVLEPTSIDDRFFPGARIAQERYFDRIRRIQGPVFLRTREALTEWDDYFLDRFHPNEKGHRKLAVLVNDMIQASRD